ncbi:MAG: porin family protein [Candidatus Eisenbacteria bacterium]|nr:porin family protein [Candidatus Eisenbacteria bacterium]
MRTTFVSWTVGLAAAVLLSGPALAAPTGLGVGVHGGYGQSADAESGSPLAGAHVLLNVAPWLGVVGSVEFKFKEDHVESGIDYDVTSYPINLLGRIYLPMGSLNPYVTGGMQYKVIRYGGNLFEDFELDDGENSFGWVAGVGASLSPAGSIELFGEVLYESNDPERDLGSAVEDAKDFRYDQWSARAGITLILN